MVARVLVVEDEDAIRAPLAAALRGAGHEVREVADGAGFEEVVDAYRLPVLPEPDYRDCRPQDLPYDR